MDKKDRTLVILTPGFPANEADSTCIPPQQVFVRNLKQLYPTLNIVVLAFEYPFKFARYQWNGITVISFAGRNVGKLVRMRNWVLVSLALRRLNKKYKLIGLLSFWMGDCAFVANSFAKKNNLKHFCWILGQDAKRGNKYFRWIKPDPGSLIALSDFIASEVRCNYSIASAHVIPMGVDPVLFSRSYSERSIDIMGAGSLIPLKQFHLLINMVSNLKVYFPGIKAVICGDGPEKELLSMLIKHYQLESNIELTGELPHAAVLALMQRTKVFAHLSSYEGLGMVCLEALYAGAEVISLVKPLNEEIKNWHIAPTNDDAMLIAKKLLTNSAGDSESIAPYLINNTCKAMMNLFDYNDAAIF